MGVWPSWGACNRVTTTVINAWRIDNNHWWGVHGFNIYLDEDVLMTWIEVKCVATSLLFSPPNTKLLDCLWSLHETRAASIKSVLGTPSPCQVPTDYKQLDPATGISAVLRSVVYHSASVLVRCGVSHGTKGIAKRHQPAVLLS